MKPRFSSLVEYEIFVPALDASTQMEMTNNIAEVRKRLIEYFGGLTDTRHKNEGIWKIAGTEVHDEVVIWKIISDRGAAGDQKMVDGKHALETILKQREILVVRREVNKL